MDDKQKSPPRGLKYFRAHPALSVCSDRGILTIELRNRSSFVREISSLLQICSKTENQVSRVDQNVASRKTNLYYCKYAESSLSHSNYHRVWSRSFSLISMWSFVLNIDLSNPRNCENLFREIKKSSWASRVSRDRMTRHGTKSSFYRDAMIGIIGAKAGRKSCR